MTTCREGHRSAVDPRARFILGQPEADGDILRAVKSAKPDAIMHFAASALVGESMANPGKVFPQQRRQRPQAARCRRRMRREKIRVQLHLRHLRSARPRADDRGPAPAPHQPLRRIQADVRENAALVPADLRTGIRRLPLLQRRRRQREIRRTSPHRDPPHPQRPQGRRSARRRIAKSTAPIIPRPTAPASAITSTSSTWRRRTSSACSPASPAFTTSATATVIRCAQVIQTCEKVTGQKIPAMEKPRRPGDPPKLVASADKAIRELGWRPKFPSLEDIVATAWAWHKLHPTGYPD